jgi:hypothetical protein
MMHRVLIFSFPFVLAAISATPPAPAQMPPPIMPISPEVNLLAPNQGGQAIIVPHEGWLRPLTEKDEGPWVLVKVGEEAVYAFKDEKPATFSGFALLIPGTRDDNIKQFEVLAADESPTGEFRSLGKFTTINARIVKSPYQVFSFPQTTARYIKIRILSSYGSRDTILPPFRLMGTISK